MKLQIALDQTSLDAALTLLADTARYFDILEIGTPLVLQEGAGAIREIKKRYPNHTICADFKIMDAGSLEAAIGFEAGADIVSVLGAAESTTIRNAAQEAHRRNRRIMVDLIALIDLETRVSEVERIGVDYICCHTAYDVQTSGTGPLEDLRRVAAAVVSTRTAVAGGVTPDRIEALVRYRPEILIVGGFVAGAKDPEAAAQAVRQAADLATGSKAR